MTCLERLKLEHPEKIDANYIAEAEGCPWWYNYPCSALCGAINTDNRYCVECWNQELPEENCTTCEINSNGTVCEDGATISQVQADDIVRKLKNSILDSGDRTEFESGAVRDMRVGKGRCDLLPLDVVGGWLMHSYSIVESQQRVFDMLNRFIDTGTYEYLYETLSYTIIFDCEYTMLLEVAVHFEDGAVEYGDNNWRKGIPVRCYIDSAIRHYLKFLRGDTDERHDRAFCWNILCAIWTCIHMPELNEYRTEQ